MREKQGRQADCPDTWDESRVRAALAAARCHAARFARRRGLPRVDREDLSQDILVAILEADPHFDPARGAWSTFVAVLARRAVADRARRPAPPDCVSLDSTDAGALLQSLVAPQPDPDIAVAFACADRHLPTATRRLLRQIAEHRDVATARDTSGVSPATFYRDLHDLRCWLRAFGARPSGAAPATASTSHARRP